MSWWYAPIVKCKQTFSDGVLHIFLGSPDTIPELYQDYGSVHTQFMKFYSLPLFDSETISLVVIWLV
jgi:hypothetical protein